MVSESEKSEVLRQVDKIVGRIDLNSGGVISPEMMDDLFETFKPIIDDQDEEIDLDEMLFSRIKQLNFKIKH